MAGTLALVGLANALVAAAFMATGLRLALRPVEERHRLAMAAIALWWLCLGFLETVQAAETLAAAMGSVDVRILQADRYLNGAFLGIGCWGLASHVAYVWSGNRAWAWRLAPVYAVAAAAHWTMDTLLPVTGYEAGAYRFELHYARPLIEVWAAPLVVATVGGTMVAAPLFYLWLGRQLGGEQRRRALLASIGILAWGLIGFGAHVESNPLADFLTVTGMPLLAAICAYIAYFPPWPRSRRGDGGSFVQVVHQPPPEAEPLYERVPPPAGRSRP